jgi:hypothetical protein
MVNGLSKAVVMNSHVGRRSRIEVVFISPAADRKIIESGKPDVIISPARENKTG